MDLQSCLQSEAQQASSACKANNKAYNNKEAHNNNSQTNDNNLNHHNYYVNDNPGDICLTDSAMPMWCCSTSN